MMMMMMMNIKLLRCLLKSGVEHEFEGSRFHVLVLGTDGLHLRHLKRFMFVLRQRMSHH